MSWWVTAVLALVSWGAFAFGAVYPWAYWPLFAGCLLVGAALFLRRRVESSRVKPLAIALAGLAVAVALQLIPLPVAALRSISPETDVFLRGYEVTYVSSATHALSIDPPATARGLAAACALSIFLLGLLRVMERNDAVNLARGLCVVGVALSLAGIIQMPLYDGKLYGFWTPLKGGNPFGPFVNRNHFAGWMLMAMPLALGYFCGRVGRGMRMAAPGWRNRVGWLSTPDANETILVAFAIVIMAVALTLTTSRSGLLGLTVALAISAWFVARRHQTLQRRVVAMAFVGFVLVAAIGWTGVDRLASRFSDPTYGNRVPIWADTLRIAMRFPLAGTGLNTYGTSTLAYQTAVPDVHLAQAHNDYLQLAAEGGLLLTIPAAVLAMLIVRTIRQRFTGSLPESTDHWVRLGAVTGLVAIALQEIGEFSLQMPGNAVLFVVLLAIAGRPRTSDQRYNQHTRERLAS